MLKGEAKNTKWTTGSAGIYVLGPNLVNNKPHWLQDPPGSQAIWYLILDNRGFWVIGHKDGVGGFSASIISFDEVAGPQEATNWRYDDGENWITTSDDILVDTFDKPGAYLHNIYT